MYVNGENDRQNTHTQKLKYCHRIYSNLPLPLQFWQHLRHDHMCGCVCMCTFLKALAPEKMFAFRYVGPQYNTVGFGHMAIS